MTWVLRAFTTFLLAGAALVGVGAGAASATPQVDDPCLTSPSELCAPARAADSSLLPVNRWVDATGQMHGRLSEKPWEDLFAKIQRNGTYPAVISLGNSLWSSSTGMASAAINMDVLDSAGAAADKAAGAIGESIVVSGLLAALVIVAIGVTAWRSMRAGGAPPWGRIGKTFGLAALFAVMLVGASHSTQDSAGSFKPGFGSPGWFLVTTNTVLSSLASGPSAALVVTDAGAGYQFDESATGDLSCAQYISTLKGEYTQANPVSQMENSVPLIMSSMWEATGLKVWSQAQFGASNPYGDFAFCRLLEKYAGVPAVEQRSTTLRGVSDPAFADPARSSSYSLAWATPDNLGEDRTMVAWAECRPASNGSGQWELAPGWGAVAGGKTREEAIADCDEWWSRPATFYNQSGPEFLDGQSVFDWGSTNEIVSDSGDIRVENYLLTLQGKTGGATASMALVYSYLLAAVVMAAVFWIIALAIIIAKVTALVMMIVVFFVLLKDMWPSRAPSSQIGKFFAQYVGMSLLVFGVQLIFAVVSTLTSMMVAAGTSMFGYSTGGSTITTMMWTAFSPAVSVYVVHMVFTKFFKLPSPFSLTGAQQWGSAAAGGAVGGAVGAGLTNRMNRMRSRAEYRMMTRAQRAADRGGSRILSMMSGGRFGRGSRSGALLAGTAAGTAAGSAVAGGAAGRRRNRQVWAATPGAVQATGTGRAQVGADPGESAAERAEAARAGAAAYKAQAGRLGSRGLGYFDGVRHRVNGAVQTLRGRSVGQHLQAGTRHTSRKAVKAGAATGAIVATGGLAAPVMAAVWGVRHVQRTYDARGAAVAANPAAQAAVKSYWEARQPQIEGDTDEAQPRTNGRVARPGRSTGGPAPTVGGRDEGPRLAPSSAHASSGGQAPTRRRPPAQGAAAGSHRAPEPPPRRPDAPRSAGPAAGPVGRPRRAQPGPGSTQER